jgi:Ni,Fe-hydrogenase III component G
MDKEEKIRQELENKFSFLKKVIVIARPRRIFVTIPLDKFEEVFIYAVKQIGFSSLSAITGLDEKNNLAVIYHLNQEGKIMLNLSVGLNKENPEIKTITSFFPGADIFERELVDLLGIKVIGLTAGYRYPLADNWPKDEYPLRKDWNKETKNA